MGLFGVRSSSVKKNLPHRFKRVRQRFTCHHLLPRTSTDITPPPTPTTTDITTDHYHRSGYRHCHRYAATIIGGSNCAASLARMYLYLENTFARFSHAATRAVSSELGNTCSTAIPRGWKVLEGRSMVLESVKHRSKTRAQKTMGGGGRRGTRTPPRNPLRCGEHVVEQSAERVLPLP